MTQFCQKNSRLRKRRSNLLLRTCKKEIWKHQRICYPWCTQNCENWLLRDLPPKPAGQTLQATALVHEAYLRLTKNTDQQRWNSRGHFFGAASTAMRRILIEQARRKKSLRGGGEFNRVSSHEIEQTLNSSPAELLTLNEALNDPRRDSPKKSQAGRITIFCWVIKS